MVKKILIFIIFILSIGFVSAIGFYKDLDMHGYQILNASNITSTKYFGDGSGLTGINSSSSNITLGAGFVYANAGNATDVLAKITAASDGTTIFLPIGVYNFSDNVINFGSKKINLIGAGYNTILLSNTTNIFIYSDFGKSFQIKNLVLNQTNNYNGTAIRTYGGWRFLIESVYATGWNTVVYFNDTYTSSVKGCEFRDNMLGVKFMSNLNSVYDTMVYPANISGSIGYYFGAYYDNGVIDSDSESTGNIYQTGYYFANGSTNNYVYQSWFEGGLTSVFFDTLSSYNSWNGVFGLACNYTDLGTNNSITALRNTAINKNFFKGNINASGSIRSTYIEPPLQDYLLLHYDFDNESVAGTLLFDGSPYKNDGDMINMTLCYNCGINSKDNAMVGNGTAGQRYVIVPNNNLGSKNVSGKITIEVWFNTSDFSQFRTILAKGTAFGADTDNTSEYYIALLNTSGAKRLQVFFSNSTSTSAINSNRDITSKWLNNSWNQIVVTLDTTQSVTNNYVIYVNGQIQLSGIITNIPYISDRNKNLYIGTASNFLTDNRMFFNGTIDEVNIYNIILDANQVQAKFDKRQKSYQIKTYLPLSGGNVSGNVTFTNIILGNINITGSLINSLGVHSGYACYNATTQKIFASNVTCVLT